MPTKLRIALAVTILALVAVANASALIYIDYLFHSGFEP
jgi:hypothetical protein